MGNQESTQAHALGGSSAPVAKKPEAIVTVNIYEPNPQAGGGSTSIAGFGVYHTGVEVSGIEYTFAGGSVSGSGIFTQTPRSNPPGGQWLYKKSQEVGRTTLTSRELDRVISDMGQDFTATSYHIIVRNCNHFSDAFCKRITTNKAGIPSWINRSANVASKLGIDGGQPIPEEAKKPIRQPEEQKSVFESSKGYTLSGQKQEKSLLKRVTSKQNLAEPKKNPWRDPNFFPGGAKEEKPSSKDEKLAGTVDGAQQPPSEPSNANPPVVS